MNLKVNLMFILISSFLTSCGSPLPPVTSPKILEKQSSENIKEITLKFNKLSTINIENHKSYKLSGKCDSSSSSKVRVAIGIIIEDLDCIENKFETTLDLSILDDGNTLVYFPNDLVINSSKIISKDTQAPTINLISPIDLNSNNITNFNLQGTCSESENEININIGNENFTSSCNLDNRWSLSADLSSYQGSELTQTITVSHKDLAGNTAQTEPILIQNYLSNIGIGLKWMHEEYYRANPHDQPILPNGCENFDTIFYVAPNGSDKSNGSQNSPFKSIQHAILQTNPNNCTLIRIAAGEYYEALNLTIWADGSGNRNFSKLTLFGEDREKTKLISKKPYFYYENEPGWEKLTPQECPEKKECNIFKKRFVPFDNFNGHLNSNTFFHYKNKIVPPITSVALYGFKDIVSPEDLIDNSIFENIKDGSQLIKDDYSQLTSSGSKKFKNLLLKIMETNSEYFRYKNSEVLNNNDHSWKDLGSAYFTYLDHDENGNKFSYLYFKSFNSEPHPTDFISTHIMYNVYINNQNNIVIQNLNLQNGRYGVSVGRESSNIKIIGNIISNNFRSIYIYGETNESPNNIEAYGNIITNNFDLNYSPQGKSAYRNFLLLKSTLGDTHGIYLLNHGSNNNIHHNFIYNVANGIQSYTNNNLAFPESNLKVHHNLIINTIDDALEPGGDCHECHWYSNHLRNTSQSIRIKLSNSNSRGPIYIYKNVFYNQDKYNYEDEQHTANQTSFYYHTPSEIPIYVYNNLFLGFRCFMTPTSSAYLYNSDFSIVTDIDGNNINMDMKLYFLNNIFSCRYSMPNISYGTWPLYYYKGDNSTAHITQKNKQPLLSHNWIGGIIDHREILGTKAGHGNERTFLLAKEANSNDPYNPDLNQELNYSYKSSVGEKPFHFFDDFNNDVTDILSRLDFCPSITKFPELVDGGLNINEPNQLSWNYVQKIETSKTYLHLIDRSIDKALPGIEAVNGKVQIGPFKNTTQNCNGFKWLLED